MAWANLGRSRSKTVVTMISLTLAVVLMNLVYTFTNGFDMEKYLSERVLIVEIGHDERRQYVAGDEAQKQADGDAYLIIYNVFQISVTNDIRFYGLLKTIGTTGRQIKRMIRQQALLLSLVGIPIGLLLGFVAGNILAPVIMAYLSPSSRR
mgnify:CR=1 FL=1